MSLTVPKHMVGIAGGSCSGKTTLAENLQSQFSDEVAALPFDDLFVGLDALQGVTVTDWESPDLYRWSDYRRHVQALKAGRSALIAALDPQSVAAGVRSRLIEPRPIVISAGYLALHDPEANQAFDTTIFIDLPEEEIVRRRLARAKPGYPWDEPQYITGGLLEGHKKYVKPQREVAEHTVDGMLPEEQLAEAVLQIIRERD